MKESTDDQLRREIRKKIRDILDSLHKSRKPYQKVIKTMDKTIQEFFISSGHDASRVKNIYGQVIDEYAEELSALFSI